MIRVRVKKHRGGSMDGVPRGIDLGLVRNAWSAHGIRMVARG
jgi:hypothetical protein